MVGCLFSINELLTSSFSPAYFVSIFTFIQFLVVNKSWKQQPIVFRLKMASLVLWMFSPQHQQLALFCFTSISMRFPLYICFVYILDKNVRGHTLVYYHIFVHHFLISIFLYYCVIYSYYFLCYLWFLVSSSFEPSSVVGSNASFKHL